jgi:uncharacterized phage protein (TIGR01671 family)
MNNRIKFRVWHKKLEKIFRVRELCFGAYVGYLNENSLYTAPIEDVELMQYTGLKDKNGKDIYDGDILRQYDDDNYVVCFGDYPDSDISSYFGWGLISCKRNEYSYPLLPDHTNYYKVIGNIFENPELVGVDL